MAPEPLLEINDLSVIYRTGGQDLPAVRGVSLSVAAGESVGIAGESGCGKSSLAATILRLQAANARVEGEVLLHGQDVQRMPWGQLRALRWAEASMIFQGALHSLNPVQRVGDQIAEPIRLHNEQISRAGAARRVAELLELVGLPAARARAYPHQLSGGQKQRIMIALALACQPSLIVADEPTTALDVMVQAQVLDVLTGLVREFGLGLLLISHDLSVLSSTCDRVLVMYAGRVVEHGPANDIFDHPNHPYSGALASAFPRIGDTAARYAPSGLPGDPPDTRDLPAGCSFHPRCRWSTDDCTAIDPELRALGPDRSAACIHADGTNAKAGTPQAVTVARAAEQAVPAGTADGAAPMTDGMLSARSLEVTFVGRHGRSDAKGVDGVDLDVASGEIVALVGESGCGKTTLARTLLGLEVPSAGTVSYAGQPLVYTTKAMRAYRRKVQLVLQDPSGALNPRQNVYESVAEGLRIHKVVERYRAAGQPTTEVDLVSRALANAGMRPPERFFLTFPHELSGGQRQRVVIAGALALEPDVLIADEPVSSLDASIRGEILALLLKLRDDLGLSVLVVTHDLGLAWNIADRIAVMYLGRIVEVGATEEVLGTPQHPYTRALLSVVPEIEQIEPIVLTGETPDPARIPAGCRFHPRCPAVQSGAAAAAGIEDKCRGESLPVVGAAAEHQAACWLIGVRTP